MRGSRRRKVHEQFYMEIEEERAELIRTLGPPILAIILCLICLCGMTWAWFTANDEGTVAEIKAAHVLLDVTLADDSSEDSEAESERGEQKCSFHLSEQKGYTLTIEKSSACSAKRGYAVITISGDESIDGVYYTNELIESNTRAWTMTITTGKNIHVKVEGCWGEAPSGACQETSLVSASYSPPSDGEGDSEEDGAGGSSESGLSLGSDSTETSESEPAAKSAEDTESTKAGESSQGEAHSGNSSESSDAEQSNSQGTGSSSLESASSGESNSGGGAAASATTDSGSSTSLDSGASSGSDSSSSSDSASN
jgi:hypothetical protein